MVNPSAAAYDCILMLTNGHSGIYKAAHAGFLTASSYKLQLDRPAKLKTKKTMSFLITFTSQIYAVGNINKDNFQRESFIYLSMKHFTFLKITTVGRKHHNSKTISLCT